jgi:hypothetical protein
VAEGAGHDPINAAGLLFAHLSYVCRETTHARPQLWVLRARNRPAQDPWQRLEAIAQHQNRTVDDVWQEAELSHQELTDDPLGP